MASIQDYLRLRKQINDTLSDVVRENYPKAQEVDGVFYLKVPYHKPSEEDVEYILKYGAEDYIDLQTCLFEARKWDDILVKTQRKLRDLGITIDSYKLHDEFIFERVKVLDLDLSKLKKYEEPIYDD